MFRITVTLKPLRNYGSIPFSYNQMLASALYKKLMLAGEFADRFSVSNLMFESMKIEQGRIVPSGIVKFVASFMSTLTFQEVYECLIEKDFSLGDSKSMIQYVVSDVTKQPEAIIKPSMRYSTLSAICVRIMQDTGKDLYLLPGDAQFNDMFFEHVYNKYLQFTGRRVDVSKSIYKEESKLNTKLITVVRNNTQIQIRGFVQRFSVYAPIEIQQTLLYAGAGDSNSVGFGCIEVYDR